MPPVRALKERVSSLLLDQGEVFSDVPLLKWKDGEPKIEKGRALVTSHGCVCEVYERAVEQKKTSAAKKAYIQVVPLQPASTFRQKVGLIQNGEMRDYFFVEGDGPKLAHHVAVLTREQALPAAVLADCTRLAQVADWQWEALRLHITLTRFRMKPEEVFRDEFLKGVDDEA
jgi:hypothetical protein